MAVVSAAGKHRAPAAFDEPIYVTRPLLPDLRDYVAALEGIWQRRWLTNKGELHDALERALCEHLRVRHLSLVANGTAAVIWVSMKPGATALTVMPSGRSSLRESTRPMTPALEVA